nr:UbiA prenyltransferase family protein [Kutzneria sp. 744]
MLAGVSAHAASIVALWLVGVLINGYIFALNDLVDLPRDRLNPAKARSPLVTGALSEREALLWSICLPLAAVAVTALDHWPAGAQVAMALLLILGAVVNVYQKATTMPLLMDVLFAVAMAAPPAITAFAVSGAVDTVVWWVTALLFLLSLQLNSIAGNLKDLASDRRTGFRTVAIMMGADIAPNRALVATAAYRRYCWMLLGCVDVVGVGTVWAATAGLPVIVVVVSIAIVLLTAAVGAASMNRLLSGKRPPSSRGRELYFATGFLVLLTAVFARAPWSTIVPAAAALGLWEAAFTLYWTWYWRTTSRTTVAREAEV